MTIEKTLLQIECNIDDMNPEHFPFVFEQLFEAGALDVWSTPIIMKQARQAQCLCVLCEKEAFNGLSKVLFDETTTLGIRTREIKRFELERSIEKINTDYGEVNLKVSFNKEGIIQNAKPEHRDCERLALEKKVPLKKVYNAALTAAQKLCK